MLTEKISLGLAAAVVTVAGLSAMATPTYASTIAGYGFDGGSFASTDPGTSWTTTDLGSGGGVPLATDGSTGQPAPSLALTMGDINDGTFLDDDYYTFTVTPTSSLSFTSFSFDINKIAGGADVNVRLYSSIGGFTAGQELGSATQAPTNTWSSYTFDLSSLSPVSTATEFRLYLYTTGTFGPNEIKLDNLAINGTASGVPEPASLALCGVGGLLLIRRKRRV